MSPASLSPLPPLWIVAGALTLAFATRDARAQGVYVSRPGVLELSGEMIAKPLAVEGPSAVSREASRRALEALGEYEVLDHEPALDYYLIRVSEGRTETSVARELMALGVFQFVEPNWLAFPAQCPNEDDPLAGSDDFGLQWHHDVIESCRAWDLHTGDPTTVIAFVDTGIRATHEDLARNRARGYDAVTRCWETPGAACQVGPLSTSGSTTSGNAGHGTGTTGVAAATGDNGVGISGVGWNLGHRMMRATGGDPLGNGFCTPLFPVCHAALVAARAGDRIISVQVGVGSTETLRDLATTLRDEYDALLVVSSGNGGGVVDVGDRDADDLILVGGSDRFDGSFGNTGRTVDLVAPAVQIRTTAGSSDTGYLTSSGTSYSAPIVAGLCGLMRSYDPSLTADEVEFMLKAGVEDLGRPGPDDIFGHGRINAYRSLLLVATRLGTQACSAVPNSAGRGASLMLFGSGKVAHDDVTLRVTGLPPRAVARVLVGTGTSTDPHGASCAGDVRVMLPPSLLADEFGSLEHRLELGLPALGRFVAPGARTVVQIAYRDPGTASSRASLSNGIQVDWF